LHERPLREVHSEVIRPTQRSPCLGCPRERQDKNRCARNCKRLRAYQIATDYLMEEGIMKSPLTEKEAKAAAMKRKKDAASAEKKRQPGLTLTQVVKEILAGYPPGHEFTVDDLGSAVVAELGRKIHRPTLLCCLREAIRAGFPATARRNGPDEPRTYVVAASPPPQTDQMPTQPEPASAAVESPPPEAADISRSRSPDSPTMAATITIHCAIDRNRLMEFLKSLGVNIVPDGVELGGIYVRSA
jgi:hypothetical protein